MFRIKYQRGNLVWNEVVDLETAIKICMMSTYRLISITKVEA